MSKKIAVAGASGLVGRTILNVLEENLICGDYVLFSSQKSEGLKVKFFGKTHVFQKLTEEEVKKQRFDYAIFAAGSAVSEKYAELFVKQGATVIDNSSFFRKRNDVPLVCAGINDEDCLNSNGIIANPNCSTIQAVNALKPLHDKYKIKRLVFTTLQSVSGAGKKGIDALDEGINYKYGKFPYRIYSNALPQIGDFDKDGYTEEENKLVFETRKILHDESIKITATAVRVPVYYCHSISVNVETELPFNLDELICDLTVKPNVNVLKTPYYPTAMDCVNSDDIFIGRVRRDFSRENAINMWIVANNLRRGAATNAVEILKFLMKNS